MATIVNFSAVTDPGQRLITALRLIRQGIGALHELDGQRAQAIGDSQATMASVFGIASDSEAQAMSDRIAAVLAAHGDSGNAEFAKLRDLVDAVNK